MSREINADFGKKVLINIKTLIEPYLKKLKQTELNDSQLTYVSIIEKNLAEIISPFAGNLFSKYGRLTPFEIQIANLIKSGKTIKEVAVITKMPVKKIETYRYNIRSKLGIKNRKISLIDYLNQLDYTTPSQKQLNIRF
ncbi:MAG: hypothetical protein BV459_08450 [Thermoplasmata archaeon M11B2D]|nr:MAG: hypothetical protein BV459_08450 [Thermoplasmata archaeon M11B2D]